VPVPVGLRGHILQRLDAERRDHQKRRLLRAASYAAALAASVVGVAIAAWTLTASRVEELDLDALRQHVVLQSTNPEYVQQWFKETHGIDLVPPEETPRGKLDYARLSGYDLGYLQGKRVPVMQFTRGSFSSMASACHSSRTRAWA
jgi:hypothetical protein